jgi:hypothetical protein
MGSRLASTSAQRKKPCRYSWRGCRGSVSRRHDFANAAIAASRIGS